MGRNYFQKLFSEQGEITLAEVINTAQCFPRYVEEDEAEGLQGEVTIEEVESIIKSMAKDKSPGPDEWPIELFQHFFDQIGSELTEVIEESRRKGMVYAPFNSTFIALIPKKENPESFEDFRPISLCNSVYKIIAKVITSRLKPILSRCISNEQFGFLEGRQIHEAIGVAQETIHSVKLGKRKGGVVKIDLSKAYDRIIWTYLRMMLTHLDFKIDFINWIMGCIKSASYAVLINIVASPFFKGKRGLRQGCSLSPLLFLLVAEGLSQLILKAKREGVIKGLEVAVNLCITHLLFVDDILLFSNGNQVEIKEIKRILELFMKATGMQVNFRKSQLILDGFNRQEESHITFVLPFNVQKLGDPFKYLGFWLKPDTYKKQDWNWLIAKIEARISHWGFKWLSRAGRLTLIKSVLLAIHVYWAEKIGHSTIWGQAWKSGEDLDLHPRWWNDWQIYIQELSKSNVRLKDKPDQLVWDHADSRNYSPKFGYKFLMTKKGWGDLEWWENLIWKLKYRAKAKLFFWYILKVNKVWKEVEKIIQAPIVWEGNNRSEVWHKWWHSNQSWKLRNLPPIICWGVWISRNRAIFQDKDSSVEAIVIQSTSIYSNIPESEEERMPRQIKEEQIKEGVPWAYFDGASQNNKARVGLINHITKRHSLKASVGLGNGSNNYVELSALKLILCWLIHRNIFTVQIFGDSLNVIKWANDQSKCQNYILLPLLEEIQQLKLYFNTFSIHHIYRERNEDADKLSKEG
eukprot:PITA_28824